MSAQRFNVRVTRTTTVNGMHYDRTSVHDVFAASEVLAAYTLGVLDGRRDNPADPPVTSVAVRKQREPKAKDGES